jgi:hypothetical protein
LLQCLEQGPVLVGRRQQFKVNDELHSSSIDALPRLINLDLPGKGGLSLSSAS